MIVNYFIFAVFGVVYCDRPPPRWLQNPMPPNPSPCLPGPPRSSSGVIATAHSSSFSSSGKTSSSSFSSSSGIFAPNVDRCNDRNATFKSCPNPCPGTCSKPEGVKNCFMMCPKFGCECNPGYVLSDNGKCILLKECSDYLRCNGDRNAIYKACPNPCPRTCQFPGGSGPCNRMCLKEGCECKEGYYLSEEGKCVQLQDCPGAKTCSSNETFVFCNVGCPTNNCPEDDSRAIVACSPPFPCGSGCSCKGSYLRLRSGVDRCILASECPPVPCNRPNEMWDGCPLPCRAERCSEIGRPILCDKRFYSCRPQCICRPGFYRNDNDICVPENQCPAKCGYNEMAVECKTICPPQVCEISYTEYACGERVCEPGCDCLPDHLRNSSGICIPNNLCPPPPTIPTCGVNEELSSCKIVCPPQSCESIYTLYLCSADITCEWGCNCISGFLRDSSGICVPSEQCPPNPLIVCGPNEVATDCRIICPPQSCESIFTTYDCGNNTICEPGCDCLDSYLRNASDICIPSKQCFSEPECDIPTECRPTCANPNPPNCAPVNPITENQDGCKCKPGYILSDNAGACVKVEECPADKGCNGDPNSIVTSCPWPCPSTCDSPNAGTCGKKCDTVGCQCKPGLILSRKDGKCILPDKCYRGNPCGVNGTFSECAFRCPNQNCPEDDSLFSVACKPGRPCPSGCLCKQYYRRKSENDDTCVLASDCPPVKCTRPNEVRDPCSSECLAEDCSSIHQQVDCFADPNNCQPRCVCIKGYLRNETGYCVPEKYCKPQCTVSPECRPTCSVPNPPGCPFILPSETNEDGCNCQKGFILSEIGGKCVKIEECPVNAGCNRDPHARVKECPLPCPSTCDAPNAIPCKRMCDPIGCECEPGYILSEINGKCILPDQCKGGNPCGPNGTFVPCRFNCPSSFCSADDSRAIVICETFPFSPCFSGCICKLNNRLLSRDEPRCIRSDECPPVNCTRPYEKWDPCPIECRSGYCEEVDQPPVTCNTLVLNCNPQCVCKKSFFRNPETDICVSSQECRRINAAKNQ